MGGGPLGAAAGALARLGGRGADSGPGVAPVWAVQARYRAKARLNRSASRAAHDASPADPGGYGHRFLFGGFMGVVLWLQTHTLSPARACLVGAKDVRL